MRSRLALLFALLASVADGSTYTCRWVFPGGTPSTFEGCNPPPVTFAAPGAKRVTLTVCAAGSCSSSTRTLQVLDARPRIVKVTPPASPVYAGDEVSVSALVAGAPPLVLSWKLPGGVTSASNPVVFRVPPGTRRVSLSLSVTNPAGNATLPVAFNVLDPKPRASIRLTPSPLFVGQTLSAGAVVTGKPPFQFRWALAPEGLTSSNPTFSWPTAGATAGSRRLTLTITNAFGSQTLSTTFRLSPRPLIVTFKPTCPDLCFFPAGSPVPFELVTSTSVSRYEYDWNGDGTFEASSASAVASHVFSAPGSYRPRVKVTAGSKVESAYSSKLVHISRLP